MFYLIQPTWEVHYCLTSIEEASVTQNDMYFAPCCKASKCKTLAPKGAPLTIVC